MSVTGFNQRRRELAAQQEAVKAEQELGTTPSDLEEMSYAELRALAKERKIEGYIKMNTEELREALKEGE